jgi:putative transcription factor
VQQVRRKDVARPATAPPRQGQPPAAIPAERRKRDLFDYMEGEIVEDYAARIRKARTEKGLTTKDLAMQIKEREHLIKKIENRELIPEEDVRKKLEKVLEIRLIYVPVTETEKKVQANSHLLLAILRSSGKRKQKNNVVFFTRVNIQAQIFFQSPCP